MTLICEKRENQNENDIKEVEKFCKKVITVKREKQWSIANVLKTGFSSYPFLMIGHTSIKMQKEIQNAMNYAVNVGVYNPTSSSPFAVRLVSQYPELDATPGTPESFDTNGCRFNRIQIINVLSETWEFLWCSWLCFMAHAPFL